MLKASYNLKYIGVHLLCHLLLLLLISFACNLSVTAQTYISKSDGNWFSSDTWTRNTWDPEAPSTNGGWGSVTITHEVVLQGDYVLGYPLTISSGGSLRINGNLSGGSNIIIDGGELVVEGNVSGESSITLINSNMSVTGDLTRTGAGIVTVGDNSTLTVNGDTYLNALLQINRGGSARMGGNVTVERSNNLMVAEADNTNYTEHADLVIMKDLISHISGIVTFNSNARVAVFGNARGDIPDDEHGGKNFTINQDGQVYVHGNVAYEVGSAIMNNNAINPYGFYINGTLSNIGGGAQTTTNWANQQYMFDHNRPFTEWVGLIPGSPLNVQLPVTLVAFSASDITAASITLTWTTASETNNSHFVVLKHSSNSAWEEIGTLKGHGSSNQTHHYSFQDNAPNKGISHYRLKQVDIDSKSELFAPIAVQYVPTHSYQVRVHPNPTTDYLSIDAYNDVSEQVTASLFDLSGRQIKSEVIQSGKLQWDLRGMEKACYVVRITSRMGGTSTYKIFKN